MSSLEEVTSDEEGLLGRCLPGHSCCSIARVLEQRQEHLQPIAVTSNY